MKTFRRIALTSILASACTLTACAGGACYGSEDGTTVCTVEREQLEVATAERAGISGIRIIQTPNSIPSCGPGTAGTLCLCDRGRTREQCDKDMDK